MRISDWSSDVCSSDLFFKGKPWYVGAFNGGADSAQIFEAGGYRFLHIGLEMAPEDDVIAWAEGLLRKYPGLPTIISIHDHLNVASERKAIPADRKSTRLNSSH